MNEEDKAYLLLIDSEPDSVFVLHEKKERKFAMHRHIKGQLTYVEGGIAYLHINDKTYVIPARHYIWIPQGIEHRLQVRHAATAVRSIYFYSLDDDRDAFYSKLGIYPITALLHEMIIYTSNFNGENKPDTNDYQFLTSLKNLLPRVSKISLPFVLPTTHNIRLRPVIDFLTDNLSQPLTLGKVSSRFNMSERSMLRLFQSELSISFLQYLKQRRIIKAMEMMMQSGANLTQIAYESGYNSLAAFSSTFKQVTGMRPSEFVTTVI
ncbi:helix-turn-helix domain-containing protein [Mucilaginibacter sp. JRF]|uniref:AraC family transcriptional regulator n=1 Tax=Mucilaginibacter sp. JRF TaxID=2780088 RepID=UPI00187F399F|nr:AraC family transcriptional regulator [Mucilaginibacter sp. JRF]MBE9583760.1 helix-turn-helix domain-containing protein [Mucilaginibacter sp. JRF]